MDILELRYHVLFSKFTHDELTLLSNALTNEKCHLGYYKSMEKLEANANLLRMMINSVNGLLEEVNK